MKKITYILAALLVCAVFIGTGSAFTYTNGATIDPSGSLSPGEAVTASMTISLPKDSISTSGSLKLTTALRDSTHWTVYVYKGTVVNNQTSSDSLITTFTSSSFAYTISGFVLDYDQPVTLYIALSGLVPDSLKGQSITVLKIDQDSGSATASGYSTYSSPAQKVYNPDDFTGMLAETQEQITSLESRVSVYTSYGVDVASVVTNLESAKTSLAAAKSAGTADISVANKKLEAAATSLKAAEKALSLAGLTAIKANTDAVDLIITELYGKGWDTEAKLLATTNQGIKNTYDVAAISYNSGGSPNVDETLKASVQALADGTAYKESASASPLAAVGSVLPIIIVIVVSVVVVVGAIFFIRRRRGGWDELG
ncbi:hypothetical protein SDC9_18371 [bioreactor metagenome]|uniref:Uncharacterized protein n=1 Tax=bioreactor metagenome TaxID=1076179 RepID=A0A644U013_9ZZZZ|nr:hypothetical protein [Methanocorpusculum sp.]